MLKCVLITFMIFDAIYDFIHIAFYLRRKYNHSTNVFEEKIHNQTNSNILPNREINIISQNIREKERLGKSLSDEICREVIVENELRSCMSTMVNSLAL